MKVKKEDFNDDNLWWNKIQNMTEKEIDLIPYSFMKKYGSFLNSIMDHQLLLKEQESKMFEGRFDKIKNLE